MDVMASSDPLNLAFVELTTGENGPTVIGLHGLASTGRSLRPALCQLVNHGIRVLLPDLLGHGASPWPSEPAYDLDDHLAALEAWANRTLGSEAVWLVGNSMGALLALAWAARNPGRARGVVAISVPLFASTSEARAYLARGDAMAWFMLRYPDVARALCRRLCGKAGPGRRFSTSARFQRTLGWALLRAYGPRKTPGPGVLPPAQATQATAGLLDELADCWLHSWKSLHGSLVHCIVEHRAFPDLARLHAAQMPILFLHGDHDAVAPIARVCDAASDGGWQLQEYTGATHALALTHAPLLGQRVARFLALEQASNMHPLPGEVSEDGPRAPAENRRGDANAPC